MQSAMQMFVARFASKDPRISDGIDAKRTTNTGCVSFRVRGSTKCGGPSPLAQDDGEKQTKAQLLYSRLPASTCSSRSTRSASATSSNGTAPSAKICTFS